jgi:very-short-patch-repair endonuclease
MRDGSKQEFARRLRRTMTDAERRLWYHLRDRRLVGRKFRRQVPIGPYVADFACLEAMLVVEVDGGQHADGADAARDAFLRCHGFAVLRFWNNDVLTRTQAVLATIHAALSTHPHPGPLPQAGEGEQPQPLDPMTSRAKDRGTATEPDLLPHGGVVEDPSR